MNFKFYITRAMTLPPREVIKKAIEFFKKEFISITLKHKDKRNPTYTRVFKWENLKLNRCFEPISFYGSRIDTEVIEAEAKKYLSHKFNLLNSGWVYVEHGISSQGLKNKIYDMGQGINSDSQGQWLNGRINTANLLESRRIWQLIYSPNALDLSTRNYLPIDWQLDFKSGYRWSESAWYRDIKYGNDRGADIKVPWELARMQHLVQFALVWVKERYNAQGLTLSAQKKNNINSKQNLEKEASKTFDGLADSNAHVSEFRNQVLDFIACNPPRYGVNWECTMEVGIRAANWLIAYDIFRTNGARFDIGFVKKFILSVYDHGLHIINNLEYSKDLTSNHYLSNIAGLLFVATFLPKSSETEKWIKFAVRELVNEMEKQVYTDGTNFEASTCYHRLVLELFFYSTIIMIRRDDRFDGQNYNELCGTILGSNFREKLYKMFDALCYLLKPDGKAPQIGDNDSGQFFKFYPREVLDMRYLIAMGAVFFKESRWKIEEFFQTEDDVAEIGLVFGTKGLKVWESLPGRSLNDITSRHFPESGWYLMRDKSNYCLISCGPNGQNDFGGHCHNDKLSFVLNLNGEDILIDPGTYLYTPDPDERNLFRSTAYHNTVVIDKEEQNRFEDGYLFSLKNDSMSRCLVWDSEKTHDRFIGEHYGYQKFQKPVIHRREILFDKESLSIKICDRFSGEGRHFFEWYFHFAPEIRIKLLKDQSVAVTSRSGFELVLIPLSRRARLHAHVFKGWTSSAYGKKEPSDVCKYQIENETGFEVTFELRSRGHFCISSGDQ